MASALGPLSASIVRFGVFEVNLQTGELRKSGVRIHLQDQPFSILAMLLEHPGQIVTREHLRDRLWAGEFVEFEQGLARAVSKLRTALGDSAENPRFIETLPKRGYRFIAPITGADGHEAAGGPKWGHSIAILPFANAAGAPELEYLCDGIAENLIFSVAQLAGLRVMAFGTVRRYKESNTEPQAIGQELHVDAVVAGRVLKRGEVLLLKVELIDTRDGALLWGEQYSRPLTDILAVQEAMAGEIFSKLRVQLSRNEVERINRRQTSDPEAYSHYLQGRYYWNRRTLEGFRLAIAHFQHAVDRDPEYALGHSGIADYYVLLSIFPYSFVPPSDAMPRAKAAALRALEIDPGLAEAYATLGMIQLCYEWDFPEAEKNFRIALDLKPGYVTAHQWYSFLLIARSRFEESGVEAQKALQIDPRSGIASTIAAIWLYFSRQFDRTVEELRKSVLIEPASFIPHLFLGYAFCAANEYNAAAESFNTACALSGDNLTALSRLGYAYGCMGRQEEATRILLRLEEERRHRFVPALHFVFVHMGLADFEAALAALEQAVRERSDYLVYAHVDPCFDAICDDPRFADLLARAGLKTRMVGTAAH